MTITYHHADTPNKHMLCVYLRGAVFGGEQDCPAHIDIDEQESSARHFFAMDKDACCAAARWRIYKSDIAKLERIVVHPSWRKRGIGHGIINAMINDIKSTMPECKTIYLHAQIPATPFYERLGFKIVGDEFNDETGFPHFAMEKAA